jgi:hypothetical protein
MVQVLVLGIWRHWMEEGFKYHVQYYLGSQSHADLDLVTAVTVGGAVVFMEVVGAIVSDVSGVVLVCNFSAGGSGGKEFVAVYIWC